VGKFATSSKRPKAKSVSASDGFALDPLTRASASVRFVKKTVGGRRLVSAGSARVEAPQAPRGVGRLHKLKRWTRIICERSEQKIFLYPTFCLVAPGTLLGVKADPPDKFQWGSRPHAVGVKPPDPPANRTWALPLDPAGVSALDRLL